MLKIKEDKNVIPKTVLFFIKGIKEELKKVCWSENEKDPIYVRLISQDIKYCYDAIRLVQKYMGTETWSCKMTHFYIDINKFNTYIWTFKRL